MRHGFFLAVLAAFVFCAPTAFDSSAAQAMDGREALTLLERAKNGDASAVDALRQQAAAGDPIGQTALANVYMTGIGGVAKDDAEAVRWMRLAADQGFASAEYYLGLMFLTGRGVPQDAAESATWMQKAADQGMPPAQNNLAVLYAVGQGVPKDMKKAVELFRKAAAQGFAESENNLGLLYLNGEGVKKDSKEAMKWFQKAAAQGHPGAQKNVELLQKTKK